jgi:hypothetical protein
MPSEVGSSKGRSHTAEGDSDFGRRQEKLEQAPRPASKTRKEKLGFQSPRCLYRLRKARKIRSNS